jgi:starch phosphorylase
VPEFYDRGSDGLATAWLARVRASLRTIGPGFGAGRMVRDYAERIYPADVVAPT